LQNGFAKTRVRRLGRNLRLLPGREAKGQDRASRRDAPPVSRTVPGEPERPRSRMSEPAGRVSASAVKRASERSNTAHVQKDSRSAGFGERP